MHLLPFISSIKRALGFTANEVEYKPVSYTEQGYVFVKSNGGGA